MLPQEIIRKKRDGHTLEASDIETYVSGVTTGAVTEGQIAAFCMAVFFRGMTMAERVMLTRAMAQSGTVLNWKQLNLPGPVLDKHSSGGVGDKSSLVLAPIVAACGGFVPMLSGRGLGHTGGTVDKFDSIPGYNARPDIATLQRVLKEAGCANVGQTDDLAPADKRIYATRDITATIESIDLITASILSKKFAAGLDALVMDTKFGSGAFMPTLAAGRELAASIHTVANEGGLPTTTLLTDMNQVLGRTAGNALEMQECVDWLKGGPIESRLEESTLTITAEMLLLGKLATSFEEAYAKSRAAVTSGKAAEHYARMVAGLGGPADFLEKTESYLPQAAFIKPLFPKEPGYVSSMNVYEIGMAVVVLGGGRSRPGDPIDHAVGLADFVQLGEKVGAKARPLCVIHAQNEASWQQAAQRILEAITVSSTGATLTPLVRERWAAGTKPR